MRTLKDLGVVTPTDTPLPAQTLQEPPESLPEPPGTDAGRPGVDFPPVFIHLRGNLNDSKPEHPPDPAPSGGNLTPPQYCPKDEYWGAPSIAPGTNTVKVLLKVLIRP